MELLMPYDEGGRMSELHEVAGEMEREHTPEGVRVRVRVPAFAAARFERFAVDGTAADGRRGAAADGASADGQGDATAGDTPANGG
ncbi:MAG TPA: hypothetical protein VGV10_05205, partial [Thermoleophilaceae bacterium]|nr:hypothetical protein [Thermoleophilaceae bacterium]